MGRHTDPDTLALIERLAIKGRNLGFWVKDEYSLIKGESYIDLVWKTDKDKSPLVTFEIETKDNERVFSNTLKIWGPSTSEVSRPWHHFMIIHKSKLATSKKRNLSGILSQNNIHLYESTFGDEEKIRELEKNLELLTFSGMDFIKTQLFNNPLGESLPKLEDMINEVLKSYPLNKARFLWSIDIDEPDLPEEELENYVTFNLKRLEKKGEPFFFDLLKEARDKRMPLVLKSPDLKVTDDKKGVYDNVKAFDKIILGYKGALPLIVMTTPSQKASLKDLIFGVLKDDEQEFCISTEDRNPPYFFEFSIDKKRERVKIRISLDTNLATKEETETLESILNNAVAEDSLILLNAFNNELLMKGSVRDFKEYTRAH